VEERPPPVDPRTAHTLSNHLAVILGFVELILSETPDGDPRRGDLEEIRHAAVEASRILGRPISNPGDPSQP
jgi:hypothetical protein